MVLETLKPIDCSAYGRCLVFEVLAFEDLVFETLLLEVLGFYRAI